MFVHTCSHFVLCFNLIKDWLVQYSISVHDGLNTVICTIGYITLWLHVLVVFRGLLLIEEGSMGKKPSNSLGYPQQLPERIASS